MITIYSHGAFHGTRVVLAGGVYLGLIVEVLFIIWKQEVGNAIISNLDLVVTL